MTEDDPEQRSITDYPSAGGHSSITEPEQGKEQPPQPDDPEALLSWLQGEASSPEDVVEELPVLIEQIQNNGSEGWYASECVSSILSRVPPPVDCPELIAVLDDDHVETPTVLRHLLGTYPRDQARLTTPINLDFLESDELSQTDRMEGYRTLSRLPPDEEVYSELRRTARMFDGAVTLDKSYPVGGFFRSYAMRCLISYLHHPERAPQECAHQAITDHPWAAVRVISNLLDCADAELLNHFIDGLDGRVVPQDFYHGQIIATLCQGYMQTTSSEIQKKIQTLIEVLLDTGVDPANWETIVPNLIEWVDSENGSRRGGGVLAAVLDASPEQAMSQELVDEIVGNLVTGDPVLWTEPTIVIAEANPEGLVKHIDKIVTTARASDGAARTKIYEALGELDAVESVDILEAVEPLVADLEQVQSAQELDDVGSVLESLSVYPPPPQLRELYGSTDEQIDKTAKKIVANLRQQFQRKTPALVPGDIDNLQALSENYSLVRRTGAVTWESPSLDSSELSVITGVARVATGSDVDDCGDSDILRSVLDELLDGESETIPEGNTSIQFVMPSYDSKWVEFAVLGAAFAQIANPEIQVVLHTPASGGWGTKKDVKEALQQYGFAPSDDPSDVVPLLDIVPTARITDGEVTVETSRTTVSDDPPYLTLTRGIDPLVEAHADIVLYNYLPGIDATNAVQLQQWHGTLTDGSFESDTDQGASISADGDGEIADRASLKNLVEADEIDPGEFDSDHPANPVHVEIFSVFTSQYAADRRQHVGPPTDVPVPTLVSKDSGSDGTSLTAGESRVDLHAVQSEDGIGELLSKIDEYSDEVSDTTMERALNGFKYTIESLPVPVDLHDAWIRDQIDQGNTWVPRRIQSRRDGIDGLADEAGFDAEIIEEAVITIDTLLNRLAEKNPLSEKLMSVLDDAAAEENQVGILCSKKTYKDMLDTYLTDRASEWVLGDDLLLLDEDSIRKLKPGEVDWIVTFGPLPPQTAIYYHHPAVEKTVLLGHADGTLEPRVKGIESKRRPFLPHRVDAKLPDLEVTTHGSTLEVPEDDKSLTDNLYQSYLSVAGQSRSDDGGQSRGSGQLARYRVEFDEKDKRTLSEAHPVIVESDEHLVSAGDYVLRSLSRIDRGDEIVILDSETRRELWEEFLREDWEDSDESDQAEEAFMDAVELWYEAVSSGLNAHSDTSDPGDGIWSFAREIESDISVETRTIVDWARSVYRAESPSDLVFRSDLRIGPRHSDGVEAVAESYGSDRMAENWRQVFTRIKAIRATHRQRGSAFWDWLANRACDGTLFDHPGVHRVTITRIQKL